MDLLADENVHGAIVEWLRVAGHDLVWAAESLKGCPNAELLSLARDQRRILVTADLDFGELVFRRRLVSAGLILLRLGLEGQSVDRRIETLAARWSFIERHAPNHFVVLGQRKTRVRPLIALND